MFDRIFRFVGRILGKRKREEMEEQEAVVPEVPEVKWSIDFDPDWMLYPPIDTKWIEVLGRDSFVKKANFVIHLFKDKIKQTEAFINKINRLHTSKSVQAKLEVLHFKRTHDLDTFENQEELADLNERVKTIDEDHEYFVSDFETYIWTMTRSIHDLEGVIAKYPWMERNVMYVEV